MAVALSRRLVIAAAVIGGLIVLYAFAGVWGVPYLIKTQAEKFAAQTLKRQASFGEIKFHPFLLALEIRDFAFREADGTRIASFKRLFVDYEPWPLLRKTFAFSEITLEQPILNTVIDRDGSVNLARVAADLPKSEEQPKSKEAARVDVARLAIVDAGVDFADARLTPTFAAQVAPMDIVLTDFSTLPNREGKHEVTASTPEGEKLGWVGDISLAPITSKATLQLSGLSLPKLASYFRDRTSLEVGSGRADLTLAYAFDYSGTEPRLQVRDGKLAVKDLGLGERGKAPDLRIDTIAVSGIGADLAKREASVGRILIDKGSILAHRGADQTLNWVRMLEIKPDRRKPLAFAGKAATSSLAVQTAPASFKVAVNEVRVQNWRASFIDDAARSPYELAVGATGLSLAIGAEIRPEGSQLLAHDISYELKELALRPKSEQQPILTLAGLHLGGGQLDLSARSLSFDALKLHGARIRAWLDKDKQLNWLGLLPAAAAPAASTASAPAKQPAWKAAIKSVALDDFALQAADLSTAKPVQVDIEKIRATFKDVSTDLTKPVVFDAGLSVKQGGQLTLQGSAVPGDPSARGSFNLRDLSLAPAQSYVNEFAKLNLVTGGVSAAGKFAYGVPNAKSKLRVDTDVRLARLDLKEEGTKETFLGWERLDVKNVALALEPNRLDIADVVVTKPQGKFIIYQDRTLNIQRIRRDFAPAQTAAAAPQAAAPKPKFVWSAKKDERKPVRQLERSEGEKQMAELHSRFPLAIRRIKVDNAQMLFSDLSIQPQFATRIHSMGGSITGLSSRPDAKAQMKLDGQVDEFGLARFAGGLNPLAVKKYTDITATFRNLELTKVTPYSARFAGYRIASGKLDADLKYAINNSRLEGANKFVIDNLELGERVDSPDALKLPLELALALLKDADGRIDLDLPVTGSLDDPEFSYGAIVWKAIVNVLTKIVTAPFRALGALLGISGDKLESVAFDPGSDRLLPPEKEKLKQIATALAKRPQLKISIKAGYAAQDGHAIKSLRVRSELAQRLGLKLQAGEDPGEIDAGDEKAGKVIASLFRERFGGDEFDKMVAEAEKAAGLGSDATREQRRQVRAAVPEKLLTRLIDRELMAEDELKALAGRRAEALKQELIGVNAVPAERVSVAPLEKLDLGDKKEVTATFGVGT